MNTTLEAAIRLVGQLPEAEQTAFTETIIAGAEKRWVIAEIKAAEDRGLYRPIRGVLNDMDRYL